MEGCILGGSAGGKRPGDGSGLLGAGEVGRDARNLRVGGVEGDAIGSGTVGVVKARFSSEPVWPLEPFAAWIVTSVD